MVDSIKDENLAERERGEAKSDDEKKKKGEPNKLRTEILVHTVDQFGLETFTNITSHIFEMDEKGFLKEDGQGHYIRTANQFSIELVPDEKTKIPVYALVERAVHPVYKNGERVLDDKGQPKFEAVGEPIIYRANLQSNSFIETYVGIGIGEENVVRLPEGPVTNVELAKKAKDTTIYKKSYSVSINALGEEIEKVKCNSGVIEFDSKKFEDTKLSAIQDLVIGVGGGGYALIKILTSDSFDLKENALAAAAGLTVGASAAALMNRKRTAEYPDIKEKLHINGGKEEEIVKMKGLESTDVSKVGKVLIEAADEIISNTKDAEEKLADNIEKANRKQVRHAPKKDRQQLEKLLEKSGKEKLAEGKKELLHAALEKIDEALVKGKELNKTINKTAENNKEQYNEKEASQLVHVVEKLIEGKLASRYLTREQSKLSDAEKLGILMEATKFAITGEHEAGQESKSSHTGWNVKGKDRLVKN